MEDNEICARFAEALTKFHRVRRERTRGNGTPFRATAHTKYDRIGFEGDPKRLKLPEEYGGMGRLVFPDIIVHQRATMIRMCWS
ncbi:hypothetical protein ELI01_08950 [Rhizobium leguminosarum]|uniref:hypothetical protein n=1 Tax=Rhizobium leguminosarum TaxID=384 RepID=UPI00103069BC|nr:hypothetical protein [Rhizobium leguminosarum]TAX55347.1 hypothetical protein ELI01_08950 [Rhizobium leguminosarum]